MATVIWAQLACAQKCLVHLGLENPLLKALHQQVVRGTELADRYSKTLNSIYWKKANSATQRRVRRTLARLAWELADTTEEIQTLFNAWCDEQQLLGTQATRTVLELRQLLWGADQDLRKYHSHQIYQRQLELFHCEESAQPEPLTLPSLQQWLENTPIPRQRQLVVRAPKQLTLADIAPQ